MLFSACVDPLDPKGPHVPLFLTTITVGILQSFFNSLLCYSQAVVAPPPETLR